MDQKNDVDENYQSQSFAQSSSNYSVGEKNTQQNYSIDYDFKSNYSAKNGKLIDDDIKILDSELLKLLQELNELSHSDDKDSNKPKRNEHTETTKKVNSQAQTTTLPIMKVTKVHDLASTISNIANNSKINNISLQNRMYSTNLSKHSMKEPRKVMPMDTVGIIEYILLAMLIVFNILLLGCCINDKSRGIIFRTFTCWHLCEESKFCNSFWKCFCCKSSSIQPYQVISVQEMGNMQRTARNDENDFVFDDHYLELNDDPVSVESLKVSSQQNSSEASNIIERKYRGDKEDNNMYKQFSNSIKKIVKPKYVRLDEVFEDTKEDGANLEEDITHHGYWNPTYFSLIDETDV